MCGFAGIFSERAQVSRNLIAELQSSVEIMTETLHPRGPDAFGHFIEAPVALGHRRLSILDLTDTGAQPMTLQSRRLAIVYNGECYNFRELRRELEALGSRFRGHSDTEVILESYACWGLDGLKRLEGIFALALWDAVRQRLVLMRDRLGVKPLYFGESKHGLAFGSEIKAVLAAGGLDRDLNQQAFAEYLWFGNSFEDRTFYRGVRNLEPGHWLIIERDSRRLEPWWRIEEWLERPTGSGGLPEAAQQIQAALDTAVRRQLVADVPIGIFLSGGVDSSSIAASAVYGGTRGLCSYAAGFDFDRGINELPKAAKVARHLGLDHSALRIDGVDLPPVLAALSRAHDEPFADAANIPLYLMSRELSGRLKVVLQGDGGDELFAGYRRYALLQNASLWRLWPRTLSPLVRMSGNRGRRFARIADCLKHSDPAMRMALLLTTETLHDSPEQLLTKDRHQQLMESVDPFLVYRRAAARYKGQDPVQQMLLTDITVQLPSQFLTKVDRATMAAGIEARVPLLDERVAELAVSMPAAWKARGSRRKILLRESQRGRLPPSILNGPKTGFGVPYGHWLRASLQEFTRERLLDTDFLNRYNFSPVAVEQALVAHCRNRQSTGFRLWKLLQLAIWQENAA
jgi:asparagine synthase (glutamine-hydrolysing)